MTEGKRTITVTVHEADEKPPHNLAYAYMETEYGWAIVRYLERSMYGSPAGWSYFDNTQPVLTVGPWVELKDIAQAVEGGQDD